MKHKKTIATSTIVALGAGAVALAASTYYFFGPEGKIHRKKAVGWMVKMKGEIIEKLEQSEEVSEQVYHGIVDSVLASYIRAGKVAPEELRVFADTLKAQWKHIAKIVKGKKGGKAKSGKRTSVKK